MWDGDTKIAWRDLLCTWEGAVQSVPRGRRINGEKEVLQLPTAVAKRGLQIVPNSMQRVRTAKHTDRSKYEIIKWRIIPIVTDRVPIVHPATTGFPLFQIHSLTHRHSSRIRAERSLAYLGLISLKSPDWLSNLHPGSINTTSHHQF